MWKYFPFIKAMVWIVLIHKWGRKLWNLLTELEVQKIINKSTVKCDTGARVKATDIAILRSAAEWNTHTLLRDLTDTFSCRTSVPLHWNVFQFWFQFLLTSCSWSYVLPIPWGARHLSQETIIYLIFFAMGFDSFFWYNFLLK